MGRFVFDFSVDAWLRGVVVEAKTLEEAKEELMRMSLSELVESGDVKETDIGDLDLTEGNVEVHITNVVYDVTDEDIEDGITEEDLDTEFYLDIDAVDWEACNNEEEKEALLADMISDETGMLVTSFEYELV